jgi:hypothetical protein
LTSDNQIRLLDAGLRQCLPDIGLRNSKLPSDCGRLDACFEGGTHCIQLASGQRTRAILGSLLASLRLCISCWLLFAGLGGRRPRRSASVVTAASSASISTSSNRFSAPAKSFGKKWHCCEARLFGPALPFATAEGPAAVTGGGPENRSGVVSAGRRVGMPPTMPPVAHRGNGWQGYRARKTPGSK